MKYGLYPDERAKMPLEDVERKMQEAIQIAPAISAGAPPSAGFVIKFRYSDPVGAQKVVQDLTARFHGEVMDPASLPTDPVGPNHRTIAMLGLVIGLGTGFMLALLLRKMKAA
jgi:hypothetical protein